MHFRILASPYGLRNYMRHHDKNRKLHRPKRQRVALLRSLARSLVLEEGIVTTSAKAKALRPFVERLISYGKDNTLASNRMIISALGNSSAAAKLHQTIAPRYKDRRGGYTRIIRLGRIGKRVGEAARIELVK